MCDYNDVDFDSIIFPKHLPEGPCNALLIDNESRSGGDLFQKCFNEMPIISTKIGPFFPLSDHRVPPQAGSDSLRFPCRILIKAAVCFICTSVFFRRQTRSAVKLFDCESDRRIAACGMHGGL